MSRILAGLLRSPPFRAAPPEPQWLPAQRKGASDTVVGILRFARVHFRHLKTAVKRHVVMSDDRRARPGRRVGFKMGTPEELSETLIRTWDVVPTPERIVEDISRIPSTVEKIIEHRGGIVPDSVLRTGRRSQRGKRPMQLHPDAHAAAEELLGELGEEIKRARKN